MEKEEFRKTEEPATTHGESFDDRGESATARQWREMREENSKELQDVSLQAPQSANTEKHVNLLDTASEQSVQNTSDDTESATEREWREMREEKNKNNQDIALQSPQDANTEKHINFLEEES